MTKDALLTQTTTRRSSSMGDDPLQSSPTTPVAGSFRRTTEASEHCRPALLYQAYDHLDSNTSSASSSRPTLEQLTRLARGDLNLGLVHLVTPNDSLASIALSYGCSQTSLRQVNKLWLSDPVHFRKELMVPLEACTKKPAQEVLVEAHVQLDRGLIRIASHQSQPSGQQHESEEAEQLAAMAAARLVDFPDRLSANGSTGTSSRGSSFDLYRINPASSSAAHAQQNQSEGSQTSGAERFLSSTNNIYASDQVDAFEPSSGAASVPEHSRTTSEAPSASAEPATPNIVERTHKLVEIKLSGPAPSHQHPKGKSRPTLSSDPYASRARKLSFRLDEQLTSPPPPRPVAPSASSSSTTLRPHNPPEALALSRRRARDDQAGSGGGWDAISVEELDMAKDIVRQVNASSPERDRSGRGHKRKDSRNRAVYQPSVWSSSTSRGQAGSSRASTRGWPGFSEISDMLTDWVSP